MAANDVSFRPATRDDARVIAELFQISSEGVADYVWSQLKDPEFEGLELIEIGTKLYGREDVKFSYQNCDVAEIDGETVGMLKLLFHVETLEILGIHCFGAEAAEIVHIGQAIMKQKGEGNSLRYFITTTFNYPTMAEAYRTAALNGINRL